MSMTIALMRTALEYNWDKAHGTKLSQSWSSYSTTARWQTTTHGWTSLLCRAALRRWAFAGQYSLRRWTTIRSCVILARCIATLQFADAIKTKQINRGKTTAAIQRVSGKSGGNPGKPAPLTLMQQVLAPLDCQSRSSQNQTKSLQMETKMRVATHRSTPSLTATHHTPASSDCAARFTKWSRRMSCLRHLRSIRTTGRRRKESRQSVEGPELPRVRPRFRVCLQRLRDSLQSRWAGSRG